MKPTIEILIGSPLVGEEARFLVRLHADLSARSTSDSILILANFEIPATNKPRQIDFFVVSDSNRGLVELKCLHGPIFGGENGTWQLQAPSGQRVSYPGENPWYQTVQAKFALSDAMLKFSRCQKGIPAALNQSFYKEFEATVCIFPNIDPRSRVTPGNFKAWVRGYDNFLQEFSTRTIRSDWTLAHWRRFALEALSLRAVPLSHAIDVDALVAADRVEAYCDALERSLKQLAPVISWPKGQLYGEELVQQLSTCDNAMLVGPSGCGKSFHVSHAVLRALESEEVPIVVRPKLYRGADFWNLIEQATAPYFQRSAKTLLADVIACGRRPLLVIDGLNECSPAFIDTLHLGVRAFLYQYGARLIIISQNRSDVPPDLVVRIIEMCSPSLEQKRTIYQFCGTNSPDEDVLDGLTNAYDVTLAAKCASGEPAMARVALYDRYCRAHIPEYQQTIWMALLRHLAEELDRDISRSLSRDRFERLAETFVKDAHASLSIVDELRKS